MDWADAIILASPIFFGSLPAQVKAMIDRFQCCWVAKNVLGKSDKEKKKKGFLILVEASNRDKFFKNAESIVKNFFAVKDIQFSANIYCPGVDKAADILKDQRCLQQTFELGKKIVKTV